LFLVLVSKIIILFIRIINKLNTNKIINLSVSFWLYLVYVIFDYMQNHPSFDELST